MNNLTTTDQPAGFGLLLTPATLQQAQEFAGMLAKSDLVPKNFAGKPGDILIAAAMGARLGLDVFSALAGIAVVNGRPTLYGDAMLAVCQSRPDFSDISEKTTGNGDAIEATCTVTRKGRSPYSATFTAADAKRAGLWGKQGPWSAMPQRMCQMRARSFALRGAFADALAGFHSREEMDDSPLIDVSSSATVAPDAAPAKVRELPAEAPQHESAAQSAQDAQEPPPLNHKTIDALARRLAAEHKGLAIKGLREIATRFSVAMLSDLPAEALPKVLDEMRALERDLAEGT